VAYAAVLVYNGTVHNCGCPGQMETQRAPRRSTVSRSRVVVHMLCLYSRRHGTNRGMWACGFNKTVCRSATHIHVLHPPIPQLITLTEPVCSCRPADGMSSLAWTMFRSLVLIRLLRIARTIFSSTTAVLKEQRAQLSPHASLERCSVRLEHIRAVIENISPERRRKIQSAAERGACRYLTDIELVLLRRVLFHSISP
jgi:hypothetical protein